MLLATRLAVRLLAISMLGLSLCALGLVLFYHSEQHYLALPNKVTLNAIRSITVGMTEDEVKRILGKPSKIAPYKLCTSQVDSGVTQCQYEALQYTYGRHIPNRWHPMLWVCFKDGKVDQVYAKRYYLVDDEGVYLRSRHHCEKNSANMNLGCSWENPLFEETFPKD